MSISKFALLSLCCFFIVSCGTRAKSLEEQIASKNGQLEQLENQIEHLQKSNSSLLDRLSDLSVISQTEAKSIQESLVSINRKNEYISKLTDEINEKDSINQALVANLRGSLLDFNDADIQIQVKGSAVYVSIADKMLFKSGSTFLSRDADVVLDKVARIINDQGDVNVMVEGHTDDVPINTEKMNDNWDLSVLRATSVVRALQYKYNVEPQRLTASGKSEYMPKSENSTSIGKSENRRTEIIITPRLDQFFELLKTPELLG